MKKNDVSRHRASVQARLMFGVINIMSLSRLPSGVWLKIKPALRDARYKDVLGLIVWSVRYKLGLGYQKTTINPAVFCTTIDDAQYFVDRIKARNSSTSNRNGILIAITMRRFALLNSPEILSGEMSERHALTNAIDDYLSQELSRGQQFDKLEVDKELLFKIENRSSYDKEVLQCVKNSIEENLQAKLVALKDKRTSIEKPSDFSTFLQTYKHLDRLQAKVFVASRSLLSLVVYDTLFLKTREAYLGVVGSPLLIEEICDLLLGTLSFEIDAQSRSEHYLKAKHESGIVFHICRYEHKNSMMVTQDKLQEFAFRLFDLGEREFRGFAFRIPSSVVRYLADQFGENWSKPKIGFPAIFDYQNARYLDRPESLVYLKNLLIKSLEKNHRRPATRAIEDINDYFELDFLHHLPIKDYFVATPSQKPESLGVRDNVSRSAVVVATMAPSCAEVENIETQAEKHDAVAIISMGKMSNSVRKMYEILRNLDEVIEVSDSKELDSLLEARQFDEVSMTRLGEEAAAQLGAAFGKQLVSQGA